MKTWIVGVKEVHICYYRVKAESSEVAIDVVEREGKFTGREKHSHVLDPETWSVKEET